MTQSEHRLITAVWRGKMKLMELDTTARATVPLKDRDNTTNGYCNVYFLALAWMLTEASQSNVSPSSPQRQTLNYTCHTSFTISIYRSQWKELLQL